MRYLCFLRAYNDVDNIAPVLFDALNQNGALTLDLIVYSQDFDFRGNENLAFLLAHAPERLSLTWIGDYLGLDYERYFRPDLGGRLYRSWQQRRHHTPNDLMDARSPLSPEVRRRVFEAIVTQGSTPDLAIFDLNRCPQLSGAINSLRELGVPRVVTLPVSPHITTNTLRSTRFNRPDFALVEGLADYECFDHIAINNPDFLKSNAAIFALFGRSFPLAKIYALGSLRYLPEWFETRRQFYQPYPLTTDKTRLVFFLSQPATNSLWDEVQITLDFLGHFPEFEIVVKPHTRPIRGQPGAHMSAPHLHEDTRTPSSALIDWADVVLVWSSSIALEAFAKNKTVLVFDYLNINRNLYVEMNAGWILRCRDDLFEALTHIKQDKKARLYESEPVQALLNHIVYGPGGQPKEQHRAYLRGDLAALPNLAET